jgi:hypothetical protein
MPHIVHAIAAAVAICVFAVMAGAFSAGEMEVGRWREGGKGKQRRGEKEG